MKFSIHCGASVLLATLLLHQSVQAQEVPPLAERLQLCAACHNADGNSTIADNPRLAGLDAGYIARQLADFKSGKRPSPIMAGIVAPIQEPEFKALAAYFNQQKPTSGAGGADAGAGDDGKAAAQGKEIFDEGIIGTAVPSCSGCHNEDGSGTDKYPRITGQHAAYVVQQLLNFKSGVRANDSKGVMQAVARRMNEQEIQAVAAYVATLKEEEEQ